MEGEGDLFDLDVTSSQNLHFITSPYVKAYIVTSTYMAFIKYCVFSEDFKIFRTLACLCFLSVSVCVHTHQAGKKTSAAPELAEFRKLTKF